MPDQPNQILAHRAGQDHLDDAQGLGIGDPQAVLEGRGHAKAVEHCVDLAPAAVNHHDLDADPVEQDDVFAKSSTQIGIFERVAADFHHHGFAAELRNIGQRLDENAGLADQLLHDAIS